MSNTRYKGRKLLQDNGNRSRFLQSLASESIVSSDMRERMDQDFDDFMTHRIEFMDEEHIYVAYICSSARNLAP